MNRRQQYLLAALGTLSFALFYLGSVWLQPWTIVGAIMVGGATIALSLPAPAVTPTDPGHERIAEALDNVLDAADLSVAVWRDDRRLNADHDLLALARALDKAGLVDWRAFTDDPGDP